MIITAGCLDHPARDVAGSGAGRLRSGTPRAPVATIYPYP